MGVSGPIGFSQFYADKVDQICRDIRTDSGLTVAKKMRNAFLQDMEPALRIAGLAAQSVGPVAQQSVVTQTLVAIAPSKNPELIQLDYQCNPELATKSLPFVAIGSGQSIADPFLAFLSHIFWRDNLPSLSDGIFAVMWTLRHAIRTAPGGISDPINIATLEISKGEPVAKLLCPNDIRDHEQAISEVEDYLKDFPQKQRPGSSEAKPPTPPGENTIGQ